VADDVFLFDGSLIAISLERVGSMLRDFYATIRDEELPERWVDLSHHLNERERQESEAHDQPLRAPPKR
jgi:hypothetical protein